MEKGQSSQIQPDGNNNNNNSPQDETRNWFKELRGSIMVVAVLIAGVTYTAGLNPPGGFWADDLNGHTAGTAILHDKLPRRYKTFFYANATAFMSSLVIIILLTNENIHESNPKTVVMLITMVLDLVSMMIAYAAGCARSTDTSMYVVALAVVALAFVFCWTLLLKHILLIPQKLMDKVLGTTTTRDILSAVDNNHENVSHTVVA